MYPLKLLGVTRAPIWGGTRLLLDWNKKSDAPVVGESWELSARTDGMCTVLNGEYANQPLSALLSSHGKEILGESRAEDGFPLLIKLLDAGDKLSVQVHPDDAYAARVEKDRGKTEMWYILEADKGAEIICGLKEGVTTKELRKATARGEVESVLEKKRVHAGECYFIPAGLPHAIGGGILLAEIQQNCDLTYRVYDYDRKDQNGQTRQLHVEKAMDVIRPFTPDEIHAIQFGGAGQTRDGLLADCDYFYVEEIKGALPRTLRTDGRMGHLLCVGGEGSLTANGEAYPITRGEGYLLPATLSDLTLSGDGIFLFTIAK